MPEELYIGLMSGTSLDCIDAVLVRFDTQQRTQILATYEHPFPGHIRTEIERAIRCWDSADTSSHRHLDIELGHLYAEAVKALLKETGTGADAITAIGCHGQTVSHQPDAVPPFSLQLGDGQTLATETGITTVNDFRSADIALGGQGAPLVPAFHEWAFAGNRPAAVINIGGIANITLLSPGDAVSGYDTGPGNTLLDLWCQEHTGKQFDSDGCWASQGCVNRELLTHMLNDGYFAKAPPKSTGREYFNGDWLTDKLAAVGQTKPADVQATLVELTAETIAASIRETGVAHAFVCGGGALNQLLMQRIADRLAPITVTTTADLGIPPLWVEAVAFAWLARTRLNNQPAGRPSVTGASSPALLGKIHNPAET